MGVVAKRSISRGEPILLERPLVTLTLDASGHRGVSFQGDPAAAQRQLLTLAQNQNVPSDSALASVIHTNAYVGMVAGGTRHSVTFLTVSRINHSCLPNSSLRVSTTPSDLGVVTALRHIAPGEEITIDYGVSGSRVQRQRHLREHFSFECRCERCTSELQRERAMSALVPDAASRQEPSFYVAGGEDTYQPAAAIPVKPSRDHATH